MQLRPAKILWISFCASILSLATFAQEQPVKRNSLGLGAGASKVLNEDGVSPAFHLHFARSFSSTSPFSLISCVEFILDEHSHTSLGAGIEYNFWKAMNFGSSLGLSLHEENKIETGLHLELSYSFALGIFDVGPMIEAGIGRDDTHFMAGLSASIGF